jgi:A/G-specific adenine glycosylase
MATSSIESPATLLLDWYDRHGRELPWRAKAGEKPQPYHVWISEIMLQQTTTATVAPYYREFLDRWPHIEDLAAAHLDAVLHAWQGLGYYARARNLHKCARVLCDSHGGRLPDDEAGLRALPGIGAYSAAAIAAIAFERPSTVVDGNVERVMARLHAVKDPLPGAKAQIRALAQDHTPKARPGDYAQGLMDLGATVCKPRNPSCGICPWSGFCAAYSQGLTTELPRRSPKAQRPTRRAMAFWLTRPDGAVLLRRRPESGLLGGMIELPSTPWRARRWSLKSACQHAPLVADWRKLGGVVHHGFTHFALETTLLTAEVEQRNGDLWRHPDSFGELALPTLTKKLVRHALLELTQVKDRSLPEA